MIAWSEHSIDAFSAQMRPWLFAIMHNLYVSRTRQRRTRGQAEPLHAVVELAVATGAHQEEHVQTREITEEVHRLPDRLIPPSSRRSARITGRRVKVLPKLEPA